MTLQSAGIEVHIDTFPTDKDLNGLWRVALHDAQPGRFQRSLRHCLVHVTAHSGDKLIGFAKVATDGGVHGFLLDVTVHPDFRREGLGTRLVGRAVEEARDRGAQQLHVAYDPELHPFFAHCGFGPTHAGILYL